VKDEWNKDTQQGWQAFYDNQYVIYASYYYSPNNDVDTIADASRTYNCHGFVWHPDAPVEIGNNVIYFWLDGSYNEVDIEEAEKIVYS
jgi:hypothetical protein